MLATIAAGEHRAAIKPWPLRRNPNLGEDQFGRDDFTIDYQARTVTCPNGTTVTIGASGTAQFKQHCNSCPLRSRCTTSKSGRTLTVGDHDESSPPTRSVGAATPTSSPTTANIDPSSSARSPG